MPLKKVLYITYDGISDPLGQSQILPYLEGLTEYGYRFTILSFEKKERFRRQEKYLRGLMSRSGIEWIPLSFTTKPPLLAKLYDAVTMQRKAVELQKKIGFDMVHCRSYIAADVGLRLKQKFGVKFLFDMRGFWADEKKDGGSWDTSKFVFRKIYQYYKGKEREYLRHADYIILLTRAAKKEIQKWESYDKKVPVAVIPCCADMQLFSVTDRAQKIKSRNLLNIKEERLVISYLGSVGTWYMLDEMLIFFQNVREKYPDAQMLIVTHSNPAEILKKAKERGLAGDDLTITEAQRHEVPQYIKASDINISFIKPVYSKISSSPTKLGEVLSMGIPVICNNGVGDVKEIIEQTGGGIVLDKFTNEDISNAVLSIPSLLNADPVSIREKAKSWFDLQAGIQKYLQVYRQVMQ